MTVLLAFSEPIIHLTGNEEDLTKRGESLTVPAAQGLNSAGEGLSNASAAVGGMLAGAATTAASYLPDSVSAYIRECSLFCPSSDESGILCRLTTDPSCFVLPFSLFSSR